MVQIATMFEVTTADIALFNDEDLRSLVGLLCEAEIRKLGLSPSYVTWGGNQIGSQLCSKSPPPILHSLTMKTFEASWVCCARRKSENLACRLRMSLGEGIRMPAMAVSTFAWRCHQARS